MKNILVRIQQITVELSAIQEEISRLILQPDAAPENLFFEDADGTNIFAHFKEAVDALRHVLWLYIETMAGKSPDCPAFQGKHLLRATEMLRVLSQHSQVGAASASSSGSFIDQVHSIVDFYMNGKIH